MHRRGVARQTIRGLAATALHAGAGPYNPSAPTGEDPVTAMAIAATAPQFRLVQPGNPRGHFVRGLMARRS